MPVGEMLSRMTARELAEWQAYERHDGLLGPKYNSEVQREIHFQLQQIQHTLWQVKIKKGQKNPVEPKRIPGPNEFTTEQEEDEG